MAYSAGSRDHWHGRVDDLADYDAFRWHQRMEPIDLSAAPNAAISPGTEGIGIALLGFACDEGVVRNQGRPGAAEGPAAIRRELRNLPCSFAPSVRLYDAGDVTSDAGLEAGQAELGEKVSALVGAGLFPVILGGGHETAFGHWLGLRRSGEIPGVVNLDAHFDLRPYPNGGSSGTMFAQIADLNTADGTEAGYLCLGVQKRGNTVALFRKAAETGSEWILARDLAEQGAEAAFPRVDEFCARHGRVMLTFCSDVVSSAWAPGVSAPQPLGLDPETAVRLVKRAIGSGKVAGFDICEVSPRYDHASITASLAATMIFAAVNSLAALRGLDW